MKTLTLVLAFAFSIGMSAQQIEPTFEKDGEMVKASYFHANGETAQTGYFLEGKLHGEWKMFDEQGQKKAMGHYHMGKRIGTWYFWDGDVMNEVDFTDNKIVNVESKNAKSLVIN
ncbi:MAG: nicotinic acid mononucleotide adenyltransferase [Bacteroidota bacterium]